MAVASSAADASPSPHHRQRWRRGALAVLLLAAVAGALWWGWRAWQGQRNPRDAYQIVAVQRGDIQDLVTATGTVQPRDYVDVGAQVSGQLRKIHVEVGSLVKEGELLAEIDPTVLRAAADARRAGLRNLRATLTERRSALALAELQQVRQRNLSRDDATTTESLQLAEAAVLAGRAQIAAAQAQIEQAESQLRADDANLNYARIFAPMAGTVVSIAARQGQTLNTNQSAPIILRVADLNTMTVQTQVSEADVSRLRIGMEVYFTTLGSQNRRWTGRLRKLEPTPTVTNNVVLYNALFDVPNPNQALMTNMTAQVFFIAAEAKGALLVPAAAVSVARAAGAVGVGAAAAAGANHAASAPAAAASAVPARGTRRASVKVIDGRGGIEEREVELGVGNRVQYQVLSGLNEGDEVVAGMRLPATEPARAQGSLAPPAGLPPGLPPRGR